MLILSVGIVYAETAMLYFQTVVLLAFRSITKFQNVYIDIPLKLRMAFLYSLFEKHPSKDAFKFSVFGHMQSSEW